MEAAESGPPTVPPAIGAVGLALVDAAKAVDRGADGIPIGMIVLRSWQVHRLEFLPPDSGPSAGFLIRVNYEFDIAPDVPAPQWVEVGFEFPDDVTVLDAVPRTVARPLRAQSYVLDRNLNFAPSDTDGRAGSVTAAMPGVEPRIDCFGLGGRGVRWRYSGSGPSAVPVGSHQGWLALLTPADLPEVEVVAKGAYRIDLDADLGLAPISRPDAFSVRLPDAAASTVPVTPEPSGGVRVFVSYAHEEFPSHKQSVRRLVDLLRGHGINVHFDRDGSNQRRIWPDWTNAQIAQADYVLVVASPTYRLAGDGPLPPGKGGGVRSEYARLVDYLHHDEAAWVRKILPVVLPDRRVDEIPKIFLPWVADHYQVTDFTADGAARLLRVLGAPPA